MYEDLKYNKMYFFREGKTPAIFIRTFIRRMIGKRDLQIYLFLFFDREGFPTIFSIFSVKLGPYLSFDCSRISCGETRVTLKQSEYEE